MSDQVTITAAIVPPPAYAKLGMQTERYTMTVNVADAAAKAKELIETAMSERVFEQHGTVVLMIGPPDLNQQIDVRPHGKLQA